MHQLGLIHQTMGRYRQARRRYEEALALWMEANDEAGTAETLHQLGIIEQAQGHYREARGWYDASLTKERNIGSEVGIIASLCQLAGLSQAEGELEGSRRNLDEALRVWNSPTTDSGSGSRSATCRSAGVALAVAMRELGTAYCQHAMHSEARGQYERSLGLWRSLGDRLGEAQLLYHTGVTWEELGDLEKARQLYREGHSITLEIGNQDGADLISSRLAALPRVATS